MVEPARLKPLGHGPGTRLSLGDRATRAARSFRAPSSLCAGSSLRRAGCRESRDGLAMIQNEQPISGPHRETPPQKSCSISSISLACLAALRIRARSASGDWAPPPHSQSVVSHLVLSRQGRTSRGRPPEGLSITTITKTVIVTITITITITITSIMITTIIITFVYYYHYGVSEDSEPRATGLCRNRSRLLWPSAASSKDTSSADIG